MVQLTGLEPACLSALEPESSASTNFATAAAKSIYYEAPPKETNNCALINIVGNRGHHCIVVINKSVNTIEGRIRFNIA